MIIREHLVLEAGGTDRRPHDLDKELLAEQGLAFCNACGGGEADLLDYCPGTHLTVEQHAWNLQGLYHRQQRAMELYSQRSR